MVYQRKRRKQYSKKDWKYNYFGTPENVAQTAKTALQVALGVKALLNVERKYKILANTFSVGTSGQTAGLNSIAQGTDDTQRIGRSIKSTSWMMRATAIQNASATVPTTCRMMVLWDRQTNGALPGVLSVLETADPLSSLNKDHGKRFKVIWDRTFILNDQRPTMSFKAYRKIGRHIEFNNTGGSITDVTNNSLVILLVSDDNTNKPSFKYNSTFRYIDN